MLLSAALTSLAVTLAAQTAPSPAPPALPPSDAAAVPTADDAAYEALRSRFENLFRSLTARRGMSSEDRAVVQAFRDSVREFNAAHPGHDQALAMEITLSGWLRDDERVDALFAELVAAKPDDEALRLSWARYFRNLNQYGRLRHILEAYPFDPAVTPEAAKWLADAHFAHHRFEEASAALDSIPEAALTLNPALAAEIRQIREPLKEYPAFLQKEQQLRATEASADDLPRVELITPRGRIVVELFENEAPNTVANFITLVEQGYYDGTRFHRVIPNFMAQGGDPNSKPGAEGTPGQGGPGYTIPDEHSKEGRRVHFAGSLSMAKTAAPNSGGSQFFLTVTPTPWLNGAHTVFGTVIEGLDVVRALSMNDELTGAKVLRKRAHEYTVEKVAPPAPVPDSTPPPPR
jgi:cyclophilin family peptidyl-prolyl cis-trans isomerase